MQKNNVTICPKSNMAAILPFQMAAMKEVFVNIFETLSSHVYSIALNQSIQRSTIFGMNLRCYQALNVLSCSAAICHKLISVEGDGHCCQRPSSKWETNHLRVILW